ncbi:GPW/gp25 family protein [Enterobacter sp. ECC-175]|uniref:GPW/gp25 family protein n=1 Tax=unclassified Enterobacter TaxID=2608935 RepID=UPI000D3F272F|nr:GPW/gp25 family protein [Enterobacter sp. RIT 418]RAU29883.1 phage baseplate protein [Enterobacter sp. RIT 418]
MSLLDVIYKRGWAFPPTFSLESGAELAADFIADIEQSLRILFNTLPAERVMHPWYGCDLHAVMFENVNATLLTAITEQIRSSIEVWEPRVELMDVAADFADVSQLSPGQSGFNVLRLQVSYRIKGMEPLFSIEGNLDVGEGQGGYFT